MPELGNEPLEPRFHVMMNDLALVLDQAFNGNTHGEERKTGFVLLVFPFGSNEGRCNYISNGADRRDVVKLFKEQIKYFEEGSD